MKILSKTISTAIMLVILFLSHTVMADEYPSEGARDDYSDHPHFTKSMLFHTDNTKQLNRKLHTISDNIEEESSLD